MNKYLKFEYWNTCDLGNIYYQGGQHFIFYLDADVAEPFHEEVEDGQENGDGDFIPTYRRQMKRYRIRTGLIPDYLIDAIQRMKLHDHIELTFKSGEVEQIYNIDVEPEWQFEKYAWQGTVTLTFDMDESITVGACCDNLTVTDAIPEWYWIATDGSDDTGDGHYTTPWLTLAYAISQVSTGSTINLKVGTYTLTSQIVLPVGISLKGQGDNTIITTTIQTPHAPWDEAASIILSSASEGTNGNQSISYLKFEGNSYTADAGILIYQRSNVKIHHCTFSHFHYYAVRFRGGANPPTIWATGNEIHDNFIYDCGGPNVSYGDIGIGQQEGMLIYNNEIYQPQRPGFNQSGFPIKYLAGGDNHGLKIYNNSIKLEEGDEYDEWHIAVELFGSKGGIEIYNNEFWGVVDFSDYVGSFGMNDEKGYGFAVKIHNNLFGGPSPTSQETYGVTFERGTVGGAYVYQNIFRNVRTAVALSNTQADTEDIFIYNNLIYNFGRTGSAAGYGILLGSLNDARVAHFQNIHVLNNTIYDNSEGQPTVGIVVRGGTNITYDDIFIRNNIIKGIRAGDAIGVWFNKVNATDVSVENNLIHDCDHTAPQFDNCSITNLTNQNNITADPLFVSTSDFHLKSTSPCINAGIATGLSFITTDYDGQAISDPPEIGAYEYV